MVQHVPRDCGGTVHVEILHHAVEAVAVLMKVAELIVGLDSAKLGVNTSFNLPLHHVKTNFYVMFTKLLNQQGLTIMGLPCQISAYLDDLRQLSERDLFTRTVHLVDGRC